MAYLTTTTQAGIISEQWETEMLRARYSARVIAGRVLNKSQRVANKGDIVHVPVAPSFTVGTVTSSTGAFTPSAGTIDDVQVSVDTWDYVAVDIVDNAAATSILDPIKQYVSDFGKILAANQDAKLGALYTNFTGTPVGSPDLPTDFDNDAITAALLAAEDANIIVDGNAENMSFILPPSAFWKGLFRQDKFSDADSAGLPKSVRINGFRYPIYGVPGYATTQLTAPNTTCVVGFLMHREALAIATAINAKYDRARNTGAGYLAETHVVHMLYGVKTVRADHAIPLYIKK